MEGLGGSRQHFSKVMPHSLPARYGNTAIQMLGGDSHLQPLDLKTNTNASFSRLCMSLIYKADKQTAQAEPKFPAQALVFPVLRGQSGHWHLQIKKLWNTSPWICPRIFRWHRIQWKHVNQGWRLNDSVLTCCRCQKQIWIFYVSLNQ